MLALDLLSSLSCLTGKVTLFPEDSCGVVGFFGNWFGVLVNPNRDFGNRFWFGVLVLVLVLVDLF